MTQVLCSDLEALVKAFNNEGVVYKGESITIKCLGEGKVLLDGWEYVIDWVARIYDDEDDWEYARRFLNNYNSRTFWEDYDANRYEDTYFLEEEY